MRFSSVDRRESHFLTCVLIISKLQISILDPTRNTGFLPGNSGIYRDQETQETTRKLRKLGFLLGNTGVQESYQEIQIFPVIMAGISGIQDSCQEIQDFPGSQTLRLVEIIHSEIYDSGSLQFVWGRVER